MSANVARTAAGRRGFAPGGRAARVTHTLLVIAVTVVPPGDIYTETCSYAGLLALGADRALLAYSDFDLRDADGRRCKGIRVREVRTQNPAVPR